MFTYEELKTIANILKMDIGNYYDENGKISGHWLEINHCLETNELTKDDLEWNALP